MSYSPSRFTRSYYVKLLFLLLATATVTWYANRGKNNPLISSSHLIVTGDGSDYVVSFIRKDRQKTQTTLFMPSKPRYDVDQSHLFSPLRGDLTIVTMGFDDPAVNFKDIPVKWVILGDDSEKTVSSPLWPQPQISAAIIDDHLRVQRVAAFSHNSSTNATHIIVGGVSILVIDRDFNLPETALPSRFKETLDVLITPCDTGSIEMYRELLRPRFLIIPAVCKGETAGNVLCPGKKLWRADFKTDNRNRLQLQN